jgi:hypothetical protein
MITATVVIVLLLIVTINTALRAISGEKQGGRRDAYHALIPCFAHVRTKGSRIEPQNTGITEVLRLGEDNDCKNYTQIDPTHRHGHIDGRLGRRLASDV